MTRLSRAPEALRLDSAPSARRPTPRRRLLLLLLPVLLAACAQRWAKPGGTPQEFQATEAACTADAYRNFPPMPRVVPISPGYFTPAQQVCRGNRCYLQGGFWVPPSFTTVDDNSPGRGQAVRACLFAQGWQPVDSEAQAAAVTAARPVAAAIAGEPSFTLVNRGRRVLQDVYASPNPDYGWGPDRLGNQVLKPGGRVDIRLPGGECQYALRFVWIGGEAEERPAVNTCGFSEYAVR